MKTLPRVYVILVNWNGWKDTLACLESVFNSDYANFNVVVCDNASEDGSLEYIKRWANGDLHSAQREDGFPTPDACGALVAKPITWVEYVRGEAESGGNFAIPEPPLILVSTGANLGFAGGNNVGMRYAAARSSYEFVWLLNNDTVIRRDALSQLIARMALAPAAGICGSKVLYFNRPDIIQAAGGGRYFRFSGSGHLIGNGLSACSPLDPQWVTKRIDYVLGASMLVRRSFIQAIGLMSEDYFLYFEELDWALRGKNGFTQAYAESSIVYHKYGGSTGSGDSLSPIADFYGIRNRFIIARKFFPYTLPFIYMSMFAVIFNRLRRGQPDRAFAVLRLVLDKSLLKKPAT